MAEQSYSFRSALNGFHRGDVISFLEELSRRHASELEEKTEALRLVREEVERLRQENQRLQDAVGEKDVCGEPCADTPVTPDADTQEQELAAYRRAERYEREARIRAGKVCSEAAAAVEKAGAQLQEQEKYLTDVSATISTDIAALQAAMGDIRIQLNATRSSIQKMEQEIQSAE